MQPLPVAGPSRVSENGDRGLLPRAKKRRRCICHQPTAVTLALTLAASMFPAANAGEASLNRRDVSLADHYIEQDDGSWVESTDWQLNGRSAQQQVGQGALNDFAALPSSSVSEAPAATASASTSTSDAASGTPSLTVPDAWTPDPRTSFYAVPVIVVMSVLLAIIIVILIIVIVVLRKRRRRRGKELRSEDPESKEDEKSVGPTLGRGRMSAAVRQRTAGLRRRGRKRKMALTRQVGQDDSGSTAQLAEEDVTEAVVSPLRAPSLMREVSRDARSIITVSTRAGAGDDDDDANSMTALTASASADHLQSVRRLHEQNPTTVFFQQPAQHRRSAVSLASVELPSAPPAYPSYSRTQPQAGPSSSRRDQKRRMTQEEAATLDSEAPPQHGDDVPPPQIDTTGFVGHVATDEKAALARLAELSSAPEESNSHVEHSAPDAEVIEQAMVEEVLGEADEEPEQLMSLLPPPPRPVVTGFRLAQPSAPPVVTSLEPSAPPLPHYEPSAPEYEADDEERSEREGHIVL